MANFGEYYQIPYDCNNFHHYNHYHYHQQQPHYNPVSYHQQQAQFGYNPVSFDCNRSEFETISSSIAYSVSNSSISEPKYFSYDPNHYTIYESPPQFTIYSSVHQINELDFNEPEFDEYDPTPYGGGYDIVSTYGKPLPPSEVTCYPPMNPLSSPTKPSPCLLFVAPDRAYGGAEVKNHGFVSESTKLPKPMEAIEEEDEEDEDDDDQDSSYGSERSENIDEGAAKSMEAIEDKEHEDKEEEDKDLSYGSEKSRKVEESEVKVQYVPSGYGLEATDLCEAIFGGYFPCVLRNKRREQDDREAARDVSCWGSNDSDLWKKTSDYIFGDLYPYGYENQTERNRFEMSGYGYRRY